MSQSTKRAALLWLAVAFDEDQGAPAHHLAEQLWVPKNDG